jgi:nucleoside-diphosphate-sugar epimerase
MTITVTGGTGFLGSRVVAELVSRGHHVRCLIRSAERGAALAKQLAPQPRHRLQLVPGNLDCLAACRELLGDSEAVVHVAAPLTGSVPSLFANGVIPTQMLVKAAADHGVKRFVLVSSLGVYGSQNLAVGDVLDEHCPVDRRPHRRDPYTYSKIAQEQVCWHAHQTRGLPLVVVRPGVLFGPGRPLLTARIGLMLGRLLVQMDGRQAVPYCYVDNCARAVAMAAEVASIEGMTFNIVDDDLPSAKRVLSLHRKYVGAIRAIRVPAWAIGRFARACEWLSHRTHGMFPPVLTPYKASALWKRVRYSNELAKSRLGWRPLVTFEDGVLRTVQAVRVAGMGATN